MHKRLVLCRKLFIWFCLFFRCAPQLTPLPPLLSSPMHSACSPRCPPQRKWPRLRPSTPRHHSNRTPRNSNTCKSSRSDKPGCTLNGGHYSGGSWQNHDIPCIRETPGGLNWKLSAGPYPAIWQRLGVVVVQSYILCAHFREDAIGHQGLLSWRKTAAEPKSRIVLTLWNLIVWILIIL